MVPLRGDQAFPGSRIAEIGSVHECESAEAADAEAEERFPLPRTKHPQSDDAENRPE